MVKRCLEEHNHHLALTPLLDFIDKIHFSPHEEKELDKALVEYTPKEIDSLITRLPDYVSLWEFIIVKRCLKKHKYPHSFMFSLDFTKKIIRYFRYSEEKDLDIMLTEFTLEEIDSLLTRLPAGISSVSVVRMYYKYKDLIEKDDFETIFLYL